MNKHIPDGFCQCGCGQRTQINTQDRPGRGIKKGEYSRYVRGHNARTHSPDYIPPVKYCACGCGQVTPIAQSTSKKHGRIKGQHTKYCLGHRKPKVTTPQGFWSRVDKHDPGECWTWLRYINDSGYGVTTTKNNRHIRASHIAYELTYGPLPEGFIVCHKCDNPACVNPAHLFAGTHTDNVCDMDNKGRRVNAPQHGESHGMSKLTADKVVEIRRLAASGISNAELGRRFDISDTHVWRIVTRQSWSHLP